MSHTALVRVAIRVMLAETIPDWNDDSWGMHTNDDNAPFPTAATATPTKWYEVGRENNDNLGNFCFFSRAKNYNWEKLYKVLQL